MGARSARPGSTALSRDGRRREPAKVPIEQYEHKKGKRVNNPPVGLVTPKNDAETPTKQYTFDPHLDPILQWSGKRERDQIEVPTVSLHVHERIDPRSIIEAVRKTNTVDYEQMSLFSRTRTTAEPLEEIEFYKHSRNWSNRIVAGDSLLVMNSLIEKEGMAEKIQMIYIDPPYGIKYGSNFQPFVNKKEVKDGRDADLNQEPETIRAFRDTWELGIHSYLSYLRDRLLLSRDLLNETGSCFVQISNENLHHIRELMDEIFGPENFISLISFQKTGSMVSNLLASTVDYIVWYGKKKERTKYRQLFEERTQGDPSLDRYDQLELPDGSTRRLSREEILGVKRIESGRRFRFTSLFSDGATESGSFPVKFGGKTYECIAGNHWKTTKHGIDKLINIGRIGIEGKRLRYKRYLDDFPFVPVSDRWESMQIGTQRIYCVQTAPSVVERCMLMCSDPGDLVFDPTCGSGTTAFVAEKWGRRWVTCDTSRVAVALAKQRLMTATYPYYALAHSDEGIDSGLLYRTAKRITLGSLANSELPEEVHLYDQPKMDKGRARVSGPFTVEAVPAPAIRQIGLTENKSGSVDNSIVRAGETLRQEEWRSELLRCGVRAKNGKMLNFAHVEPISGTRWLHAQGTSINSSERAVISFGPTYAPLEQKQVALAIEEANALKPKPDVIVFAAFQYDSEASKDIDEAKSGNFQILKAQMNADLLTADLKKKRSSNESFWLVGQPDVRLKKIKTGEDKGLFQVTVHGFDYYNPTSGEIDSGDESNIAMWMLDTDYDGQALFARQVFFPMAGTGEGWNKLAKSLKSEIDEDLVSEYGGTMSLPFKKGTHKKAAIKIIDDRGIESIRILDLE